MNKVFLNLAIICVFFNALGDGKHDEAKEMISPGGIKFWYLWNGDTSLVHVNIAFKNSGAAYQTKDKAGVSEFFSNAIFCGAGKYSKTQFAEECANLAIKLSVHADMDNIYISFTAPTFVLKEAVVCLNMAISNPLFEKDKVQMIQNALAHSLQNYAADPTEIAFSTIIPSMIFKDHPYECGKYGSPEDIMKLSIEDLRYYKSKFLVTNNVEICITGGISREEVASLVDKIFHGVEKGVPSPDSINDITPNLGYEIKKYYAKGPQSSIFFVLKTEPPKSAKRSAAVLLCKILGEGYIFKGRILSKLRTENGLIYGGTVYSVDLKHSSYIFGILQTDNSKVQSAINLLKNIVKDLRENGINEAELQFAKNNTNGKMLVNLRTSRDICNFYFHKKLQGFGTGVLAETIASIKNVTLEEVNSLAKETLDENNMTFTIIGGVTE